MIVIVGRGQSGKGLQDLLEAQGLRYLYFDDRPERSDFRDPQDIVANPEITLALISPGYPLSRPWIEAFKKRGGQVQSELQYAQQFLEKEFVIGITGSVGKSTITAMVGAGLEKAGCDRFVGGNFGIPLSSYMAQVLSGQRQRTQCLVLECSSYQLELCEGLRFDVSTISNVIPNHMDRYPSFDAYFLSKCHILRQARHMIMPKWREEFTGSPIVELIQNSRPVGAITWVTQSDFEGQDRLALLGAHNWGNAVIALAIGRAMTHHLTNPSSQLGALVRDPRWFKNFQTGVFEFAGLPYRLHRVSRKKAITVNDSKATTISSVLVAAKEARLAYPDRILYLLLGGRDKGLPWNELSALNSDDRMRVFCFGEAAALAAGPFRNWGSERCQIFPKMKDALLALEKKLIEFQQMNSSLAPVIVLSPGGSSLDEFQGFEDRGAQFDLWSERVLGDSC